MKKIDLNHAKGILTNLKKEDFNQIFSVIFKKRTNGEIRKMVCRYGVTEYLAGGTKAFKDEDHELKTVFDMQKQAYRSIALESLIQIKVKGEVYIVEENQKLLTEAENQKVTALMD